MNNNHNATHSDEKRAKRLARFQTQWAGLPGRAEGQYRDAELGAHVGAGQHQASVALVAHWLQTAPQPLAIGVFTDRFDFLHDLRRALHLETAVERFGVLPHHNGCLVHVVRMVVGQAPPLEQTAYDAVLVHQRWLEPQPWHGRGRVLYVGV